MATLFVSHSSKDDLVATDLEYWLRARGFSDLFLDHSAIVAGENWARALREAASSCRVVICIVTEHWLDSDECFGEFNAAWYIGKPIVPLLLVRPEPELGERLAKVLGEYQALNVSKCIDVKGRLNLSNVPEIEGRLEAGLRAAGALARIGLDPEAFESILPCGQRLSPGLAGLKTRTPTPHSSMVEAAK